MNITTIDENVSRFSLKQCYGGPTCKLIDSLIIGLAALLILGAPLPFGSVEYRSMFFIELTVGVCIGLWWFKLFFLANPAELKLFHSQYRDYSQWRRTVPLFHRKPHLATFFRILTLGYWPRKNPSFNIVQEENDLRKEFGYISVFGFPIRNTGLEKLGVAFLLFLGLQLIPFPSGIVSLISPATQHLYHSAEEAAGVTRGIHAVSLNPFLTLSSLLLYCAYFFLYIVTVNSARTRQLYLVLVYAMIASALFQSVYGLYELLSGRQHIFLYQKKYFLNSASGTFINRNHFAAYVGLAIPLLMGLIAGHFMKSTHVRSNFIRRLFRVLDVKGGKLMFQFLLFAVLISGAAFSLSLTGLIAVILSCFTFLLIYHRFRKTRAIFWILGLTAFVICASWFSSEHLRQRISGLPQEVFSERSRFSAWRDTIEIVRQFPLLGTGSGTFAQVFPIYKSFGTSTIYSNTHNEYLQLLSENGLPMALFLVSFLAVLGMNLRRLFNASPSRQRFIQVGAFSSLVLVAAHNFVDFSFDIPAVALTTMVILALFLGGYRGETETNGTI